MKLEEGFRIGDRDVHPLEGRIGSAAGSLRVEPKAMEVLLELARHAGTVRSRRDIERAVWPRGFVTEDVLTRCIGQLRRALGDDPRAPRYLQTLHKRGYRLRVEPSAAAGTDTASAQPPGPESLLVLPFRHLSSGGDDFVAEGLTELLILRLCGLRGMRILSRTTSMQLAGTTLGVAQVAERTGADWIVEGSVLQAGDRVQVVAQLIAARTDAHVWAADFTRDLPDLLAVQNEIAEQVAAAVRARLGSASATVPQPLSLPPPVMRDYLRGRMLMSRRTLPSLRAAIEAMAAVSAAMPAYAPAWASRAECEMLLMHYGAASTAELLGPCDAHLERALALDPELAIGLSTRGAMRFFFALDFDGAARDLAQALALLPSYSLAMVQMASVEAVRWRFDEASAWIEQALLADPYDVGLNMNLGDHMLLQRRWTDAVRALERGLELEPKHRPSRLRLAWAHALGGDAPAARAQIAACASTGEPDATWLEWAAMVEAACGDVPAATAHDDALRRLASTQRVSAWARARAAAAAGRSDDALDALAAAAQERSSSWPFLRLSPAFANLRDDSRFDALAAALPRPPANSGR